HRSNVPRGTSLGLLQLQIRFVPRGTNPPSYRRSKEPGRLLAEPPFARNRLTSEGDEAECQFLGGRIPGRSQSRIQTTPLQMLRRPVHPTAGSARCASVPSEMCLS